MPVILNPWEVEVDWDLPVLEDSETRPLNKYTSQNSIEKYTLRDLSKENYTVHLVGN